MQRDAQYFNKLKILACFSYVDDVLITHDINNTNIVSLSMISMFFISNCNSLLKVK